MSWVDWLVRLTVPWNQWMHPSWFDLSTLHVTLFPSSCIWTIIWGHSEKRKVIWLMLTCDAKMHLEWHKVNKGWLKFAHSSEENLININNKINKKWFCQLYIDIQYTIIFLEQSDFVMKDLLKESISWFFTPYHKISAYIPSVTLVSAFVCPWEDRSLQT